MQHLSLGKEITTCSKINNCRPCDDWDLACSVVAQKYVQNYACNVAYIVYATLQL